MNLILLSRILKMMSFLIFLSLLIYHNEYLLIFSNDIMSISAILMMSQKKDNLIKAIKIIFFIKKSVEFLLEKSFFKYIFGA